MLSMKEGDRRQHALKARLLADLVCAMEAGHVLQASTVAALLGRTACELVNQSAGVPGAQDAFVDLRMQSYLRNVVAVLSVAERHFGDVLQAVNWYLTDQSEGDVQQTPEAMIAAGRLQDAYRRLLRSAGSFSQP